MTIRTDVTVNYEVSPRIATVAAPSVEISLQDLHDTLTTIEDSVSLEGPQHPGLISSAGKEDLGGSVSVGITATLQDAQVAFETRVDELETGTVTTPDTTGFTLIDTAAFFEASSVARGDLISNTADGSYATVIEVIDENELICDGLQGGSDNQFDSADAYVVFDVVQCSISGGNLVAVDDMDVEIDPVFTTFGTQVIRTASSSATLQELARIQSLIKFRQAIS